MHTFLLLFLLFTLSCSSSGKKEKASMQASAIDIQARLSWKLPGIHKATTGQIFRREI